MKEKKFVPKKGQVDFTNIRYSPVINCILKHKGKILLVQRSEGLRLYPGYWSGVSGFLDDKKSLMEKAYEELREELGLSKKHVISAKLGAIQHFDEPVRRKTWLVHPLLLEVDTDKIKLNWEGQKYKWIKPAEVKNFKTMFGFTHVLASALNAKRLV